MNELQKFRDNLQMVSQTSELANSVALFDKK